MSEAELDFDTSTVMRLLVGSPVKQFRAASHYLSEKVTAGGRVHVCDLVLAEAYFALQHFYGHSKSDALATLAEFSRFPGIFVSVHARKILSMHWANRGIPPFSCISWTPQ
ncbi:MAG: hypothetical protein JJT96_14135 [Opitutales bacterium]|nr:hypothetical protein [Opitutales bacterium]